MHQFTQLRSLSVDSIRSEQTQNKILSELPQFQHLTHLNMTMLLFKLTETTLEHIINTVWSLPQLIHCHMKSIQWSLDFIPTVTSSTLKYLSLDGGSVGLSQLARFFTHTPHLKNLFVRIDGHSNNQVIFQSFSSMTTLKIHWLSGSENELINILASMPNLYQLKIETQYIGLNGSQWEQIISDHLPKLKKFHLSMKSSRFRGSSVQTLIENLLNSFRTVFWLDEHQWFVRCDWDLEHRYPFVHLYTWPYAFHNFSYYNSNGSKSTSLDDINIWPYRYVHSLSYNSLCTKYTSLSPARFPHPHHLKLFLPWDDHFWSIVPKLDQLTSLHISRYEDDAHSQIQTLLDRAPHLYSLTIDSWSDSNVIVPINLTSKSIRRLEFKDYFNDARSTALSRSSLGIQCEVLVINVVNRTNLLELVNTMPSLQALTFQYTDGTWKRNVHCSSSTKENHIEWLQQHLPSMCSVIQDTYTGCIRLWIR